MPIQHLIFVLMFNILDPAEFYWDFQDTTNDTLYDTTASEIHFIIHSIWSR